MPTLDARMQDRIALAGLTVSEHLRARLLAYYDLLLHWNAKINLTSLDDPDAALDRLIVEPMAAAPHLPMRSRLADLGSGGGSPAIPLALALESPALLMVESKSRKAAFLREAVRTVGVQAVVEGARFEDVATSRTYQSQFEVVSMRAVKMDASALTSAGQLVCQTGCLALFVSAEAEVAPPEGFRLDSRTPLFHNAELVRMSRDVFHVER